MDFDDNITQELWRVLRAKMKALGLKTPNDFKKFAARMYWCAYVEQINTPEGRKLAALQLMLEAFDNNEGKKPSVYLKDKIKLIEERNGQTEDLKALINEHWHVEPAVLRKQVDAMTKYEGRL